MGSITAEKAALTAAQQSARSVASTCTGAKGTVSGMTGLSMPGCDIVNAAWSRFANATGAYISAFGEAADILSGKVGAAAAAYQQTETNVTGSMTGVPA